MATETQADREVLRIEDLHTSFYTREGEVKAVNGVNLSLKENRILGVVGESGSGKSVTALSMLRLVPHPGKITKGAVHFKGMNLMEVGNEQLRRIRGKDIAMIFQEPTSALNPLLNVGTHMEEIMLAHSSMSKQQARERSLQLLREMDLPAPAHIMRQYPFQLSGGQAQRVMIAMAMVWDPQVLIADEITSNLDVTLQADVLDRLKRLQAEKHSAILLITHDMGVIAKVANEVSVMYAGSVVEYSDTQTIFRSPYHPYTWALLQSHPATGRSKAHSTAYPRLIPGPDRPTGPVPLHGEVSQGHQLLPAQPQAPVGGGRAGTLRCLLQQDNLRRLESVSFLLPQESASRHLAVQV